MNKCYKHSNKNSIRQCSQCGAHLCEMCIEILDGDVVCYECKTKYKSKPTIDLVFDDVSFDKQLYDLQQDLEESRKKIEESVFPTTTTSTKEPNSPQKNINLGDLNNKPPESPKKINSINLDEDITKHLKKNLNNNNNNSQKSYDEPKQSHHENEEYKKVTFKHINPFFCFIFSLIPGAGQMYLGLMNRGLAIGLIFSVLTFAIHIPAFVFMIYIFSFFDTHQIKNKLLHKENVYDDISDLLNIFKNPIIVICMLLIFISEMLSKLHMYIGFNGSGLLSNLFFVGLIIFVILYFKRKGKK